MHVFFYNNGLRVNDAFLNLPHQNHRKNCRCDQALCPHHQLVPSSWDPLLHWCDAWHHANPLQLHFTWVSLHLTIHLPLRGWSQTKACLPCRWLHRIIPAKLIRVVEAHSPELVTGNNLGVKHPRVTICSKNQIYMVPCFISLWFGLGTSSSEFRRFIASISAIVTGRPLTHFFNLWWDECAK